MIYRKLEPRFRPARRQLRVYITEALLTGPKSTSQLSDLLDEDLDVIRGQLLILRHHYVVTRAALFVADDDAPHPMSLYHWNALWELTEHGRGHMDSIEFFQCVGCAVRRVFGRA